MGTALIPTFGWPDFPEYRGWMPQGAKIPARQSLLEPGVEGDRLTISGLVLTKRGAPLADVKLQFWQADAAGVHDRIGNRLRGVQRTDKDGRFRLETVMPGYAGGIRRIHYLARTNVTGRKQPLYIGAAIFIASDDELGRLISSTERPYMRPGATRYGDDPAVLSLSALPIAGGVRQATYNIVFDTD